MPTQDEIRAKNLAAVEAFKERQAREAAELQAQIDAAAADLRERVGRTEQERRAERERVQAAANQRMAEHIDRELEPRKRQMRAEWLVYHPEHGPEKFETLWTEHLRDSEWEAERRRR